MDKIIAYLAIKHEGDWDAIYKAINEKEQVNREEIDRVVDECKYNYITIIDEKFPTNLKGMYKPPFVLFYKGNFDLVYAKGKVGMVSSKKKLSPYAEDVAKTFTRDLVDDSHILVLTDNESIWPAVEGEIRAKGGSYIKVLSSNIDDSNTDDYENCLVITEYPCKSEKHKGLMSQGKLMGALSGRGMLVVEAKKNDKCMIAVTKALENSIDIYAIPHRIDEDDGCNGLIKEGAFIAECARDITEG